MTSRIRVATIGAGYFSQFHYDAWHRLGVELVAICDRNPDQASGIAKQYGIPRIFSDVSEMLSKTQPDLLDIIVPPSGHWECIEAATNHGVSMICQKPFTNDLNEARRAVALAQSSDTLLVIHENFRFQPWYREVKRLLDEERLGDQYQITFRLRPGDGQGPQAYLDRQPYFQKQRRFLINETAVHLIDVFRYLFGEIETVWADLRKLNPVILGEDAGIVVFGFESGERAIFDGNRLSDHTAENRRLTMGELTIEGSEGTLRLDGNARLFLREFGSNEEKEIHYYWEDRSYGGDCVYHLQRHVLEHIQNNGTAHNTGSEYLKNLEIVEKIYESGQNHQKLKVS